MTQKWCPFPYETHGYGYQLVRRWSWPRVLSIPASPGHSRGPLASGWWSSLRASGCLLGHFLAEGSGLAGSMGLVNGWWLVIINDGLMINDGWWIHMAVKIGQHHDGCLQSMESVIIVVNNDDWLPRMVHRWCTSLVGWFSFAKSCRDVLGPPSFVGTSARYQFRRPLTYATRVKPLVHMFAFDHLR